MALFGRKETSSTKVATAEVDPALAALTGEYEIDAAHSSINFTVRYAMVNNVRGSFGEHEGTLTLDGTDPANSSASIDVSIGSISTGSEGRDGHLLSGDFFEVEKYPKMTFRSTSVEHFSSDAYRITGDLTVKDVTRPLSIDLEFLGSSKDAYGNELVGFEGSAELLRSDWGLTWNTTLETGGVLVGDKIKLGFAISAKKKAAEAA
jgi:polyisoprenoid-binding protein YceI